jgi:hypothetical protein
VNLAMRPRRFDATDGCEVFVNLAMRTRRFDATDGCEVFLNTVRVLSFRNRREIFPTTVHVLSYRIRSADVSAERGSEPSSTNDQMSPPLPTGLVSAAGRFRAALWRGLVVPRHLPCLPDATVGGECRLTQGRSRDPGCLDRRM